MIAKRQIQLKWAASKEIKKDDLIKTIYVSTSAIKEFPSIMHGMKLFLSSLLYKGVSKLWAVNVQYSERALFSFYKCLIKELYFGLYTQNQNACK